MSADTKDDEEVARQLREFPAFAKFSDDELKRELSAKNPYAQWLRRTQIQVSDLPLPKKSSPGPR